MKISRLLCLVAVSCSGCAWARFRPYEGAQQNWPTAPGVIVERSHGIPAYFGPPPRRYKVIGMIDATTAPVRRNGVVAFAARRAREIGGDAIIVLSEGHEFAGTFNTATATGSAVMSGTWNASGNFGSWNATTTATGSTSGTSLAMFKGKASALVIKWL